MEKISTVPPHLRKLESVDMDILWRRVASLGTHITKMELERAIFFARAQVTLAKTTRFKSCEYKLPFAVTVSDSGVLYLSVGKKHKTPEEGGYLGKGSVKTTHKALKLDGELSEVVAELTVQKDLLAALKEYDLMSQLKSTYIMDPGETLLSYSAKKTDKLAMFQRLMDSDASILSGNKLSLREKLKVVQDVATGLAQMHRDGVVHNDLTSRNILVIGRGDLIQGKINDLGRAEQLGTDRSARSVACSKSCDVLSFPFLLKEALKSEVEVPEKLRELVAQLWLPSQERHTAEKVATKLAKIWASL